MKRLDLALVELKLASSRTKAQRLIEAGEVEVLNAAGVWCVIQQVSFSVIPSHRSLRLNQASPLLKYVSRGGLKLEAALHHLKLNVRAFRCFDVGLSTGGFTDCLLQNGAAHVVGLDVGHGQLAAKLKNVPNLLQFEGVNIREIENRADVLAAIERGIDLCVTDVSFISVLHVIPILAKLLKAGARLLLLVKPQFEVGPAHLDKRGVVEDERLFADVLVQVLHALDKCGFSTREHFPCAVKGQDGNQEFFVFAFRS